MAIEGPGWPRLYHDCPNRCGLNCAPPRIPRSGAAARTTSSSFCCADMPDKVRNAFIDESSETTPDGRRWPRPSPVLMEEGDAAFTVFHCPSAPTPSAPAALLEASRGLIPCFLAHRHTVSRNVVGPDTRQNAIFRIRAKAHNPDCPQPVNGVSDHPDRGQTGEWLDYPPGSMDPFARSKHLLAEPWEVWQGALPLPSRWVCRPRARSQR